MVDREFDLNRLSDSDLLELRLCDLRLGRRLDAVRSELKQLKQELRQRQLRAVPRFWFSSEWFSPDGIVGIALPFYLAHPRLRELEQQQMLEVEGGTSANCLRLLRHEMGHAIDSAFRLHRKRSWRKIFGKYSLPYAKFYHPKPYSRRYVQHLDLWYAQSHPAEDWAETFAVWLDPTSNWQERYKGWPAIAKLRYVDELMTSLRGRAPLETCRVAVEPLSQLRITLGEHYTAKKNRYARIEPEFYDRDLRRLFPAPHTNKKTRSGAALLARLRPSLRRSVARWTGEYQYTIDQVIVTMISRCRQLNLRYERDIDSVRIDALALLTVQTMNYIHGGHHRLAR